MFSGAFSSVGPLLADPAVALACMGFLVATVILSPPLSRHMNTTCLLASGFLASVFLIIFTTLILGRELFAGGISPDIRLAAGCLDGSVEFEWNISSLPNMLLYAPLAFFALLIFRTGRLFTLAVLAGIVVVVELTQNILDLGVCQELDILENWVGILVGLVAERIHSIRRGDAAEDRRGYCRR